MAKRKMFKGWEWVRTDGLVVLPQQEKQEDAAAPRSSAREVLGPLAIGAGVIIGLIGLFRWQAKQNQADTEPQVVHVEAPAEPQVRSVAIRVPKTRAEFEPLLASARKWMPFMWNHSDDEIAVMVWADCWKGVVYPGQPRPDDHPSVTQVHGLIRCALAVARQEVEAERAARGEVVFEDAPRAEAVLDESGNPEIDDAPTFAPGELDFGLDATFAAAPIESAAPTVEVNPPVGEVETHSIARMTHERPTPGYFYRVDDETVEGGVEGLATLAVLSGLLEAAHAKGWSAERTMKRAEQVTEAPNCVIDYEGLIRGSGWNGQQLEPLLPGAAVWLPPIERRGLLNRRQPPTVKLDPRPWADGSSRIEPPPEIRPRWGSAEVIRLFGGS